MNAQVISVTGHTAITTQGVYTLGPGHHARPGQVITVPKAGGQTIGHTRQKRNVSKPTLDDPLFLPPPVQREFATPLPERYPSAALGRGFWPATPGEGVPDPLDWWLAVTNGWQERSLPLKAGASAAQHQSAGALLLNDGSGLGVVVWGGPVPNITVKTYRAEPPPSEEPLLVTTLPGLPQPEYPVPEPVGSFQYGSSVAGTPTGLRVAAYILAAPHGVEGSAEPNPLYLWNAFLDIDRAGNASGWTASEFKKVIDHHEGPGVPVPRPANTIDGRMFVWVKEVWVEITADGPVPRTAADVENLPGLLRTQDNSGNEFTMTPLPWPLSAEPGTSNALEPDRHQGAIVLDQTVNAPWMHPPTQTATITRVEALNKSQVLLHLDHLPPVLAGWEGSPGVLLPHLPAVLLDDPDRVFRSQYPVGTVLTWDGPTGPAQSIGKPVTSHVHDSNQSVGDLPEHPLNRPDRPPLAWRQGGLGWVSAQNPPSWATPPDLTGAEQYPLALAVTGGTLTGLTGKDGAGLPDTPALTPKFRTLLRWALPGPGEYALTVTWPAFTARAAQVSLALRTDWKAVKDGKVTVKVNGTPVSEPKRLRAWLQRTYAQNTDTVTTTLTVTTDRPLTLTIGQLSLLLTQQAL
ncbi:hypothetical protein [Deinococcus cavernae]|uniref:hypothetical protein n=1 Tax=Deinococcus cavernae TaxID=2320857 RepID=UPI0011C23650|nr:hypothetical protein [Deinococcus cavernae]